MSPFPAFDHAIFRSVRFAPPPFIKPGIRLRVRARVLPAIFAILLAPLHPAFAAPATPGEAVAPSPKPKADGTTYYLLRRVALTTESGVRSIPTGSEVHFVASVPQGMKVRLADGTEIVVAADGLTRDSARAQQLADEERGATAAAAAEARAGAAARITAETTRRQKEMDTAEAYVRKARLAPSAPAPEATPRPWNLTGSALDEKPRVVATVRPPPKGKKK